MAPATPPAAPPSAPAPLALPPPDNWLSFLQTQVLPIAINLIGALAILLVGWLVAGVVASAVVGATSAEQLAELVGAAASPPLPPELVEAVDAIHRRYPNPTP